MYDGNSGHFSRRLRRVDAQTETPKASRREIGWRGGIALPIRMIRLGGLGSIINFSSGVRGGAPAKKWIWWVLRSTKRIPDRQKRQNDQLHCDQLLELQYILTLNRDKFGTGFGIRPEWPRIFSGQALKSRDCPEKFGTDGYLVSSTSPPDSTRCATSECRLLKYWLLTVHFAWENVWTNDFYYKFTVNC